MTRHGFDRAWAWALGLGVGVGLGLLAAGCGTAPTGADVTVVGAETLKGDQIKLVGMVNGETMHTSLAPATPRALAHVEDLEVLVPDAASGQVLTVTGTVLMAGTQVGSPVSGAGVMVLGRTKRIVLCFDPDTTQCSID